MSSSRLVVHVDGSRVEAKSALPRPDWPGRNIQALGWAAVACFEDRLIEESGAFLSPANHPIGKHHEHIAFIQGVLLSQRLGVSFKELTLIGDDVLFGHAPTWLHPANLLSPRRDQLLVTLAHVIKERFDPTTEALVLRAFEEARIVKIKGHQLEVHQERADFLAKHSARTACGQETELPLSFEDWLSKGFKFYEKGESKAQVHFPAFTASLNEEPEDRAALGEFPIGSARMRFNRP